MVIVMMGVSGCGKSTLGRMLAERLGCPFVDADDFHSDANRAKMAAGIPLTDDDREPWLREIAKIIASKANQVVACSALKERYRKILDPSGICRWVYLRGDRRLLAERLAARKSHFFDPRLLDSQLEALEEPLAAVVVDIAASPEEVADAVLLCIGGNG